MTDAGPRVGHSVEIHEPGGRSSLGRVQQVGATTLVAVPSDAAITMVGEVGASFEVEWPVSGGAMVQSATLSTRRSSPQVELWEFQPTAAPRFEQRRLRLRIPASDEITVTVLRDDGDDITLTGSLVDLSEAALQCVLELHLDDVIVAAGTPVVCRFPAGGTPLTLRGTVHAAWTVDIPPRVRVVVRFEPDQADAATLACHVADTFHAAEPE